MYLHKQKKKDGDMYLSIKEKYHVPKVGSRERTVESLGYLSKLKTEYDDPLAYFDAYAKKLTANKKAEKLQTLTVDRTETLELDECDVRNLGYGILKRIYRELEMSDIKMHEVYRGLSQIEDSFKVTKTYFNSRPVSANPQIRHKQKRRHSCQNHSSSSEETMVLSVAVNRSGVFAQISVAEGQFTLRDFNPKAKLLLFIYNLLNRAIRCIGKKTF